LTILKYTFSRGWAKTPNIGSPKITNILNDNQVITSQATVARILKEHKKDWNTNYSKFHDNKDVVLHFHNKDTVMDIVHNKYYHEQLAYHEIRTLLDKFSFINLKRYEKNQVTDVRNFTDKDNLLIHGDNIYALHKLKALFKRKVRLIYIDPPYNTERNDLSYRDRYSRSDYLLFLKNRLDIAKYLLQINGVIFIHCDDNEHSYIKVLCDEIFGEENFISQIVWKRTSGQQNRGQIANTKDYLLVFAKNKKRLKLNKFPITSQQLKSYSFHDSKGKFRLDKILNKKHGYYEYEVTSPSGKKLFHKWNYSLCTFNALKEANLIYWSKNGIPSKKVYLKESTARIANDLWITEKYGTIQEATSELQSTVEDNYFSYPKPEKLLKHIIELATNENDLVLDFFAGSGTTLAVAHKLNRQYIGVELANNNFNLIVKRLKKVQMNVNEISDKRNCFITSTIK